MEQLGKFYLNKEILDSLIFYFMLSLLLTSNRVPEQIATKSLRTYIQDGKENGVFHHEEVLGKYLEVAYSKIPAGFLRLLDIPTSLVDGIHTIDVNYSWVKKL